MPLSPKVSQGQRVEAGELLAVADLSALEAAGKEKTIMIVFTNAAEVKSVSLENLRNQPAQILVAQVEI